MTEEKMNEVKDKVEDKTKETMDIPIVVVAADDPTEDILAYEASIIADSIIDDPNIQEQEQELKRNIADTKPLATCSSPFLCYFVGKHCAIECPLGKASICGYCYCTCD